jgi:hypothetical protein
MSKMLPTLVAALFAATATVAVAQTAAPVTPAAPAAAPTTAPVKKEAAKPAPQNKKFSTSSESTGKVPRKQTKEQAAARQQEMQARTGGPGFKAPAPAPDKNAPKPPTKDMNPKNTPVQK